MTFALVKFLLRLFTALNLLPSIATLAFDSKPICRHSSTKRRTHLLDRAAVVLAEVRNRLVIRHQTTNQPHHLDVAPRFAFQPAARLHPVEITVNVQLVEAGDGQLRLRQDFGGDDVSFLAELLDQCCLQIPNLAGVLDGRLDHNQLRAQIDTIDRC